MKKVLILFMFVLSTALLKAEINGPKYEIEGRFGSDVYINGEKKDEIAVKGTGDLFIKWNSGSETSDYSVDFGPVLGVDVSYNIKNKNVLPALKIGFKTEMNLLDKKIVKPYLGAELLCNIDMKYSKTEITSGSSSFKEEKFSMQLGFSGKYSAGAKINNHKLGVFFNHKNIENVGGGIEYGYTIGR